MLTLVEWMQLFLTIIIPFSAYVVGATHPRKWKYIATFLTVIGVTISIIIILDDKLFNWFTSFI